MLYVVGLFDGGPGHLIQIHGIMDQIQTDKNQNMTPSARNLIIGRGWMIFHQDNDPKQTSISTQKCVTEHKIKLLP